MQNGKNNPNFRHGLARSRLDNIFNLMVQRCHNPKVKCFSRYGGRGIEVCEFWRKNRCQFFDWAMKNGYRDDLWIDRIDNDKGYNPDNCRWVSMMEQNSNRRDNVFLEKDGVRKTIAQWARDTGISSSALRYRKRRGWSDEKILSTRLRQWPPATVTRMPVSD